MKFTVKFLFLILAIFILNIVFYFVSDDYRFFLEKLKYKDKTVYIDDIKITDEYDNEEKERIKNDSKKEVEEQLIKELDDPSVAKIEVNTDYELSKNDSNIKTETILWSNYKNVLNAFKEKYVLKNIEVNSKLFELTDEYPDYYYEYYSNVLTIYFFPSKSYTDVYDIFNYLKDSSPFTLKEVNNFWEKSFYINLKEEINDNYIRLVISKNGITFWLKIKKDEYNNIKEILLKL